MGMAGSRWRRLVHFGLVPFRAVFRDRPGRSEGNLALSFPAQHFRDEKRAARTGALGVKHKTAQSAAPRTKYPEDRRYRSVQDGVGTHQDTVEKNRKRLQVAR